MNKEDIGDPDLLHQPAIEGHALVAGAKESQPLILPIMPQVQGHGEILGEPGVRPDRNGLESFLPYNPLPSSTAVTNTPWLSESEVMVWQPCGTVLRQWHYCNWKENSSVCMYLMRQGHLSGAHTTSDSDPIDQPWLELSGHVQRTQPTHQQERISQMLLLALSFQDTLLEDKLSR